MATEKPWGEKGPFTRVKAPQTRPAQIPATGNLNGVGHDVGTRREEDFPVTFLLDLLMRKTVLLAPSWVKTIGPATNDAAAEKAAEQELLGDLLRSFQTWTDAPP